MSAQIQIRLIMLLIVCIIVFTAGAVTERYRAPGTIVSYISQSEILELEKARLDANTTSSRQLFFGQPERAIAIIKEMQKKASKPHHIILLAEKAVYGKEVKSISKEVYQEIIKQLQGDTKSLRTE